MATLTGTTIKDTYKSLIKVNDNEELAATLQELTDGLGNGSGISINTSGDLKASGILEFGSLKDTGEDITIVKFVDQADGIASNNNDTTIPTSAAVKDYVDTNVTAQDLDFTGNTGTGAVDLDSQTLNLIGANGVVTTASGQTITIDTSSLDTRLTTAEADIDTNTANIATEISDRTSADSTLQSNIDAEAATRLANDNTLQGNIDTEASTRSSADTTLQANIDTNTANISSNDTDIAGLDTRLTTAEGNITSNDTDIATNASNISTNTSNISTNTSNIATNVTDIATNATNISSNDTDITALQNDKYDKTGGTISGSVTISDDLTVNGTTTTVNTETLSVEDPLIEMANQNAANSVDTGFYAKYSLDAGTTTKYAGLFKDASDSDTFKLFRGLEVEPTTTINTGGTGYALADLDVAGLSASSGSISGDLIVDTNTLYVDSVNNRVGIGTDSPSQGNLVISPTAQAADLDGLVLAYNPDGASNRVRAKLYIDSFNGVLDLKSGSDVLTTKISSAGNSYFNGGNVGIGTNNPSGELHILNSTGDADLWVESTSTNGDARLNLYANSGGVSQIRFGDESDTNVGLLTYEHSDNSMQFRVNDAERMRIDSAGVVKIFSTGGTSEKTYTALAGLQLYSQQSDAGSPYTKTSDIVANGDGTVPSELRMFTKSNGSSAPTERLRIDSNGRVGIGMTPSNYSGYMLQINGGTQSFMSFGNSTTGTGALNGLVIGNDSTGADIYQREEQPLRFHTNNTEQMRIDSSGNVGIGATPYASTLASFTSIDLGQSASMWGYLNSVYINSNAYFNNGWKYKNNDSVGVFQINGNVLNYRQAASGTAGSAITLTEVFTINSTGNVGIGTTAPNAPLEILFNETNPNNDFSFAQKIDANFSGADNTTSDREQGGLWLDIDSSADGDLSDEHRLYGIYNDVRFTGFTDMVQGARIYVESNNSSETVTTVYGVNGVAVTDSNANGGIGTMIGSRGEASIQDAGSVTTAMGVEGRINIASTRTTDIGTTSAVRGEIQIDSPNAITYGDAIVFDAVFDNNEGSTNTNTNSYLFKGDYQGTKNATNAWGIYVEGDKHYLQGNLGINVTDPDAQLEIVNSSGGSYRLGYGGGTDSYFDSENFYIRSGNGGSNKLVVNSSGRVGIGTTNPGVALDVVGAIRATGDVTAFHSSDERLKANKKIIENATDKIEQIGGYEFDWLPKEGVHINEGHDIGVIAQEVEKVIPEVVVTRDNGYKAVKYEKLVPLLIEAVKELSEKVKILENK